MFGKYLVLISEELHAKCATVSYASFEAFTALTFQVEFFWVVRPCDVMVEHQSFRGPCFASP
jgi:hypothetical protein